MQVPITKFTDQLHKEQLKFLQAFDAGQFRFALLRWHRRARKTTLFLNVLIREWARNPNKIYGYIAPTYTQAKGIIWLNPEMLFSYIPEELIKRKNEAELFVEGHNGSILSIQGADNPDSIRGKDFEGVVIDEWALCKREIWEEILSPVINQNNKRFAFFGFTPKGMNHAYDYWCNAEGWPSWYRSVLRASESGIFSKEELERMKREMPESLYRQEMECDFLVGDDESLIKPIDIEGLKGVDIHPPFIKKLIACDPSQGGDECVIYVFQNNKIIEEKFLHYQDTMKIAGELAIMGQKHKTLDFAVDTIGIGKGVGDRLAEMGRRVSFINSAAQAQDKDRFANKRAEMWWTLMEKIKNREIEYPKDEELRRQISSVRYKVVNSNGKIQLEPKEDTNKRLGRSPDRADAFVYGIYHVQFIQQERLQVNKLDGYKTTKETESQSLSIVNF